MSNFMLHALHFYFWPSVAQYFVSVNFYVNIIWSVLYVCQKEILMQATCNCTDRMAYIMIRTDIGSAETDLDVITVTTANNAYKYRGNSKYVPFQTLQIA